MLHFLKDVTEIHYTFYSGAVEILKVFYCI